jgi:hypothetical protein
MLDSEDADKITHQNVNSFTQRHSVMSQNVRFVRSIAYNASVVATITEFMKSS